jgi:hypothetical protein
MKTCPHSFQSAYKGSGSPHVARDLPQHRRCQAPGHHVVHREPADGMDL